MSEPQRPIIGPARRVCDNSGRMVAQVYPESGIVVVRQRGETVAFDREGRRVDVIEVPTRES